MGKSVSDEIACSKALGYNLGLKVVRGAYMVEERAIAGVRGVESPIWDRIEETHECYNTNIKRLVENVSDHSYVIIASHNEPTIVAAKQLLAENGVSSDRVQFAQLKGFSDHLAWGLAAEGYKVRK